MIRTYLILLLCSFTSYAQDRIIVDDNSIWFIKGSCAVDSRCFHNIDDWISTYTNDSTTIVGIELRENVYEKATNVYTDCRIEELSNYLYQQYGMEIQSISATSLPMNSQEMRTAIQQQDFRTIIFILEPTTSSEENLSVQ